MNNEYVNNNIMKKGIDRENTLAKWQEVKIKWGLITAGAIMVSMFGAVILEFYAEANGWNDAVALSPFILTIIAVFISAKKGTYSCPFCHTTLGKYRRRTDYHCRCCGEKIFK